MQPAKADLDEMFGALANATRRDIVRRAIDAEEGVVELADHYQMSFAAVQKHIAVLERAGLITKVRIGRRKVVRTNVEALRATHLEILTLDKDATVRGGAALVHYETQRPRTTTS